MIEPQKNITSTLTEAHRNERWAAIIHQQELGTSIFALKVLLVRDFDQVLDYPIQAERIYSLALTNLGY